MPPNRLAALLLLALLTSFVTAAETRSVSDATGRAVQVPEKISRVYAAGPPASVFVFSLVSGQTLWLDACAPPA